MMLAFRQWGFRVITIGLLSLVWQCVTQPRSRSIDTGPFLSEAEAAGLFDQMDLRKRAAQQHLPKEVASQIELRPDVLPAEDLSAEDQTQAELSSDEAAIWAKGLASHYAPTIYLNDGSEKKRYREPYQLGSIHDFLAKAGVKYINPVTKVETVCLAPGGIKADYSNLYDFDCAGVRFNARAYNPNLQLFIPKQERDSIVRGGNPQCYVTSKFVDPSRTVASNIKTPAFHTSGHAEVSYMFWYPYNGHPVSRNPVLRKIFKKVKGGHHEGDWEHMSFRVSYDPEQIDPMAFDPSKVSLEGVHYAAHGQDESVWYKKPANPIDDIVSKKGFKVVNGRHVGFVGTQTHATYNRVGHITRFAVDKDGVPKRLRLAGASHILPSEKTAMGIPIDCRGIIEMLPVSESKWQGKYAWLNFPGRMGSHPGGKAAQPGPSNIIFKSWFYMQDGF